LNDPRTLKVNWQPTQITHEFAFPEQVWCKLQSKSNSELPIGICYKTPNVSIYKDNTDVLLRDLLDSSSDKRFVLMGDFNYPDIDWKANQYLSSASKETQLFWNCL